MKVQIRKATINDLQELLTLSQELFEYERAYSSEYDLRWSFSPDGQKLFTKRLKSRSRFVLVAEVENQIVGYAAVSIEKFSWRLYNPVAEIENLSIASTYRRKGIGTLLMEEVMRVAKKRGAKRLKVIALSQNSSALNFYRTCGYKEVDIILEKSVI